ncbi:MAG: pyridoxal phosphate-dependent aminotransferase family protein [Bacteroidales bacterium]
MDIFERVTKNRGALGVWQKDAHGYFTFPKLEGEIGPRMKFRGKEVLTWSLNNYCGLANMPEVREADAEGAKEWGLAYPMGARMMSGQTKMHEELEQKLASFVKKPSAYLLNYGYQGMVSIIDSLASRNDVIVYDSESHACIMDGIFLHKSKGGKSYVFPHNDVDRCEKMLGFAKKITDKTDGGILVITEGVFGMAGDLGVLDKIADLKEKHDFRLLVDDAHGFGTMGEDGSGTGTHFGVQDKIDIYFSTFAKAMASIGAFVAGPEEIIDYLMYTLRSQIFAKSLPMPFVYGALKRLDILQTRPEVRKQLWNVVHNLQKGFTDAGFNIGNTQSPVTPVFLEGTTEMAANLTLDLRENYALFCSIVIYPVVPKGTIMLRIIPTADHTLEDVKYTIDCFKAIKNKLDTGQYASDKIHLNI